MIEFKDVSKIYGNNVAVNNINLKIEEGEFICFIGTSGSGKTTSMRMINKMVIPTKGEILINGTNINEINDVELRRSIGYVIQNVGLMPHMNIYDNIVMVPRLLKWDEEKMQRIAKTLLKRVDLDEDVLKQYPSELSGGMQQRIGVIRALAADQNIILMDEPFGALDPITRDSLQRLIKKLQKDLNKTVVFVTHDMDEALNMADKIVVMDKGEIVQVDSPANIVKSPANDFVRDLIGEERLNQASFDFETVQSIMRKPIMMNENQSIGAVAKLMAKTKIDDVLLVNDHNILTGRIDMYALANRQNSKAPAKSIMKKVTYIKNDTAIRDAIYYIQELGHRNLSVVDDMGKLVGIITRGDIVANMYDAFWTDYEPEEDDMEEAEIFENYEKVDYAADIKNGNKEKTDNNE